MSPQILVVEERTVTPGGEVLRAASDFAVCETPDGMSEEACAVDLLERVKAAGRGYRNVELFMGNPAVWLLVADRPASVSTVKESDVTYPDGRTMRLNSVEYV